MLQDEIKTFFHEREDKENAEFQKRIVVTNYYVYGLKTAVIENYAKELVKRGVRMEEIPLESFEEILLAGMVLARSKISAGEKIKSFDKLIDYFDNWAHCDMIVSRLKGLESEKVYFEGLLKRKDEFQIRVGIIYLMSFILRKDVRDALGLILSVKNEAYYVRMAQAWSLAEAGIRDYSYTLSKLKTIEDKFLRNKAISKMRDSYRITIEQKEELKGLRL